MQSTSNVNANVNGIHCKVATQDTVRRFYANSTEFNALLDQICSVFGLSKDSVVLKYIDDEGDLVTISSDAELKFAVDLAPRGAVPLLKLKVELTQPPVDLAPHCVPSAEGECKGRRMCNKKWRRRSAERADSDCHERRKDKSEKRCHKMRNPECLQTKLTWAKEKQEKLQARLATLESDPSESSAPRLERIRAKLAFISSKITWLEQAARDLPPSTVPEPTSCPVEPSAPAGSEPAPGTSDPREEIRQKMIGLRFALRQAQLQFQLKRTNFHLFVAQPGQPNEQFQEQVQRMKSEFEEAKKEVCAKRMELHQFLSQSGEMRSEWHEMKKCGKRARKCHGPKGVDDKLDDAGCGTEPDHHPGFRHHHGHRGYHGHHGYHGHRGHRGHHGHPGHRGQRGPYGPGPFGGPFAHPFGGPFLGGPFAHRPGNDFQDPHFC
jgi:hypothetical protein